MRLRVNRNIKKKGGEKLMHRAPRPTLADKVAGEATDLPLPVVDSVTLMAGRRELIIRHGTDTYRLRLTASNKLILTK